MAEATEAPKPGVKHGIDGFAADIQASVTFAHNRPLQIYFMADPHGGAMKFLLCLAAFFSSLVHAQDNGPLSGLWWDRDEPGWGLSIHQRGDLLFATLLVYGEDGVAQWYFAPRMECGPVDGETACNGPLFSATGPTFEPYDGFDSSRVHLRPVGDIEFFVMAGANGGVRYSVDGHSVTRRVQPLLPAGRSSVFSGVWINPAEPGWGLSIHHRDDVMFVTLLAYDGHGTARWYVAPRVPRVWGIGDDDVWYSGDLYLASGPILTSANAFDAAKVSLRPAGHVNLSIVKGVDGGVDIEFDGTRIQGSIMPFRF